MLTTPIYPFLLGLIWIASVCQANISDISSVGEVLIPSLVVVGILSLIYLALRYITKDPGKAGLTVFFFFLFTLAHGIVRDTISAPGIPLAFIWLGFMLISFFLVWKLLRGSKVSILTTVLNVVVAISLVVSLVTMVFFTKEPLEASFDPIELKIGNPSEPLPDIYYIVPDTYTSFNNLETYWEYDNADFLDFLRTNSFYVNEGSWGNYHHSILSISSVLNSRYWLDEEMQGGTLGDYLTSAVEYNEVSRVLSSLGYSINQMGSWWDRTSSNYYASREYSFGKLDELSYVLYKSTLWHDVIEVLTGFGESSLLRETHLEQLEALKGVSLDDELTFTFCHLLMPHTPYVFTSEGGPSSYIPPVEEEYRAAYLEQLKFTSKKLQEVVSYILDNSSNPPIIVIASDEGYAGPLWDSYWRSHRGLQDLAMEDPDTLKLRQGTILAIYNPYGGSLEKPISPVNIFRYVLDSITDSNLEYLEDRYYLKSFTDFQHEYIDITDYLEGVK